MVTALAMWLFSGPALSEIAVEALPLAALVALPYAFLMDSCKSSAVTYHCMCAAYSCHCGCNSEKISMEMKVKWCPHHDYRFGKLYLLQSMLLPSNVVPGK